MALITCPECGQERSDQAAACPRCGLPGGLRYDVAVMGIGDGPDCMEAAEQAGFRVEVKVNEVREHFRQSGPFVLATECSYEEFCALRAALPGVRLRLTAEGEARHLLRDQQWKPLGAGKLFLLIMGGSLAALILFYAFFA